MNIKKRKGLRSLMLAAMTISLSSCWSDINTVGDSHFDENGVLIDSTQVSRFKLAAPSKIRFFVEVSGSMNGFFRPNIPTHFKEDVWQILSYYSGLASHVTILTNSGNMGKDIPMSDFQTKMNTGAFISSASTQVPVMLQSIVNSLDTEGGEVAVLISDMKYSPVGAAAPNVLLSEYSTDIGKILGTYQKSVSLVGATSNYMDKRGASVCDNSPYYFFIIGKGEHVANIRNGISSMLEMHKRFIDNIDSGFDFGVPTCTFGIPNNCYQLDNEPTFIGFEGDTCTIKMKVDLENYRWTMANPKVFAKAIKVNTTYGSNVSVGNIEFEVSNITKVNGKNELVRKATAIVDLKVFDLAQDSEVIEWTLDLPDTDATLFAPYLGATNESDVSKSYSLENFIKGMFQGSVVNKELKSSYILISRNS